MSSVNFVVLGMVEFRRIVVTFGVFLSYTSDNLDFLRQRQAVVRGLTYSLHLLLI